MRLNGCWSTKCEVKRLSWNMCSLFLEKRRSIVHRRPPASSQRWVCNQGGRYGVAKGGLAPPTNIWNNKNKGVFYKRKIKVCVSCSQGCPWTSAPSTAHLTNPCISVLSEATHKVSRGPLKDFVSVKKALQASETKTRELLGGSEENSVS